MIPLKSKAEVEIMRENGEALSSVLEGVKLLARPGVTTTELDRFAEEEIRRLGGTPAFKGYRGFPAVLCTSINHEVVHGIPSRKRRLESGDLLKVDIGMKRHGLFADMAYTIPVGLIDEKIHHFLDVAETSLWEAIKMAKKNNRLGDVSHAVQAFVETNGFSVVRDYVGHGIGREMHEEPVLPNFGPPNVGPRLEVGMVLAIEPMVNMGGYEVRVLDDGWTVVTADSSLSAHFEHSVAITETGPKVLTRFPSEKNKGEIFQA